jgi:hypothetical protein
VNIITCCFLYSIIEETDITYKYFVLGKGFYLFLKHVEYWKTCEMEYSYLSMEMNEKEKKVISQMSIKSKIQLLPMVCMYI